MESADVCEDWEQLTQDTGRLDKELEKLTTEGPSGLSVGARGRKGGCEAEVGTQPTQPQFRLLLRNKDSVPGRVEIPQAAVELESGSEESLRTQYAPTQPTLKILTRPKHGSQNATAPAPDRKTPVSTKSLKQREKEYSEARMRILGDVRFLEEEKEAALEDTMSPAEILKMKVSRCVLGEERPTEDVLTKEGPPTTGSSNSKRKTRTRTPLPPPPSHFPPSKTDYERIERQPRGPDGSPGFATPR